MIHKLESIQDNETYRILWDFQILKWIKKKTEELVDCANPADH